MKGDYLGAFEELVLLAVQALAEDAYGANIERTLEREARRPVSLGAVTRPLSGWKLRDWWTLRTASRLENVEAGGGASSC